MVVSVTLTRIVVLIVVASATAGQLAYLDALTWGIFTPGPATGIDALSTVVTMAAAHAAVSIASGIVACLIVFRPAVRAVGGRDLAIAIAAWSYLLAYPGIVVLLRPPPGLARTAFEGHFLIIETMGLAALIRFTGLFPQPLALAEWASSAESGAARILRSVRSRLLRPGVLWTIALGVPAALVASATLRSTPIADAGLNPLMDVLRVGAATAAVLNLRDSWVHSAEAHRRSLTWLLAALSALLASVLLVIGGNILLSATQWPGPAISWRPIVLDLGVMGFVLGLAATQLSPTTADPVRVARRIVGGTALLMTLLLTATVLEVLLASGVFGPVSLPAGLGTMLAIAVVASMASRLHRFFGRLLDQSPGFGSGDFESG